MIAPPRIVFYVWDQVAPRRYVYRNPRHTRSRRAHPSTSAIAAPARAAMNPERALSAELGQEIERRDVYEHPARDPSKMRSARATLAYVIASELLTT